MANRKRRKRAYIPPPNEVREPGTHRTERAPARGERRGGGRQVRDYPKPSWGRTLKRLPIYFALIFALQYLLPPESAKGLPAGERLVLAASMAGLVTVVFAPFMHLMDRWAYRRWQKHHGGGSAAEEGSSTTHAAS